MTAEAAGFVDLANPESEIRTEGVEQGTLADVGATNDGEARDSGFRSGHSTECRAADRDVADQVPELM